MRWLAYFILAYLILGLQIGLRGQIMIGSAWPNLVLLGVIFIAINAPRDAALLGAFGLGVIQDLTTQQPLGVFALSYGLLAMFTVSTQQVVYRAHPLTHFSLALVGSLLTSLVMLLQGWIRGPVAPSAMALFYSALYTAALAPIVLGLLNRMRRAFSFQPARRKLRL
jgi:rod shape-determining protein MreD